MGTCQVPRTCLSRPCLLTFRGLLSVTCHFGGYISCPLIHSPTTSTTSDDGHGTSGTYSPHARDRSLQSSIHCLFNHAGRRALLGGTKAGIIVKGTRRIRTMEYDHATPVRTPFGILPHHILHTMGRITPPMRFETQGDPSARPPGRSHDPVPDQINHEVRYHHLRTQP